MMRTTQTKEPLALALTLTGALTRALTLALP